MTEVIVYYVYYYLIFIIVIYASVFLLTFLSICPSYNLCEECEDKPDDHKHEKTHIFVKLKRAATIPVPEGPILTEVYPYQCQCNSTLIMSLNCQRLGQ